MKRYLVVILCLVLLTGCTKFSGNQIKNDDYFLLEFSTLNDIKDYDWYLEKGTILDSTITNTKGKLEVSITNLETNESIYQGNEKGSIIPFSITIRESGTYKFKVVGTNAKGSVSFKVRGSSN